MGYQAVQMQWWKGMGGFLERTGGFPHTFLRNEPNSPSRTRFREMKPIDLTEPSKRSAFGIWRELTTLRVVDPRVGQSA